MDLRRLAILPFFLAVCCHAAAPSERWLEAIPRASRDSLISAARALVRAENRQDWHAVYELRPDLDRETETEAEFQRRWTSEAPGRIIDFEPTRSVPSLLGAETQDEKLFDVLGCAQVRTRASTRFQTGSIAAHLVDGAWLLDGVHLITDSVNHPEPCTFHRGNGLLASGGPK